jgi:RNA polymerase sigma-70 factor (ECF subfamily)
VEIRNSDAAIIAASGGDPARFGEIFDRHFAAIHRYLTRRLGASQAEDLAAETFVIAFRSRRRYDGSAADARPWLFGIAANLLRRHWRTEQRRLRAYARTGVDPVADEIPDAERRLDAAAAGPQLARALASISADDREEQIALALEIPAGTVRSRLSRARKQLREQLSPSGQLVDGGLTNPEGVGNG